MKVLRGTRVVVLLCSLLLSCAGAGAGLCDPTLTLLVRDPEGAPLQARACVRAEGSSWPVFPDSNLLNHSASGGYFYVDGAASLLVPAGVVDVTVGRGFEWTPFVGSIPVAGDDTLVVVLSRAVDLRPRGWFGGDMHAHAQHGTGVYYLSPTQLLRMARAEGLAVMHLLDDASWITGAPDPISDAETILYRSIEVRNQTYGHASLAGIQSPVPDWCCQDPEPAYPMLYDLRLETAGPGSMMVLSHPRTTNAFHQTNAWPGAGLGRELPVLAALGSLDALDVVSYSNDPDPDWSDWYELLSAGIACSPSAGTDALLNAFHHWPAGGWRVYANLGEGAALGYAPWIDAVRAGRTFVTSYPLIPSFTVAGKNMGETIEEPSGTLEATVHIEASCAIGLTRVSLIADGATVWSWEGSGSAFDSTFTVQIATPAWIAARVEGASHPHAPVVAALAHTNAIRVTKDGAPRRKVPSSAHWLEELDRLETMVMGRGNWDAAWHPDTVLARIQRARDYYGQDFPSAPGAFLLIEPEEREIANQGFSWTASYDPDPGDSVSYRFRIAEDSTMTNALVISLKETSLAAVPLPAHQLYWWSVEALDRGRHATVSTPPLRRAVLGSGSSNVGVSPGTGTGMARAIPTPSASRVRLEGFGPDVGIYDVGGRRVAELGRGIEAEGSRLTWDGSARGHPAPPGIYWARSRDGSLRAKVVRMR